MAKTAKGAKPNLFAKAAKKTAKPTGTKRKKGTTWEIPEDQPDLVESLHEVVKLGGEMKVLRTQQKHHMTKVAEFAFENLCEDFAEDGIPPETPLKVASEDGESVSYVIQDRSQSYEIKDDEIVETLTDIVGEDRIDDCVMTFTKFGLNPEILEIDGVTEAVSDALNEALSQLKRKKILTGEQCEELLTAEETTRFRPGIVARACTIMGKGDPGGLKAFLEAVPACVRYIKS